VNRTYVDNLNPHSPVRTWEISPCLREIDPRGEQDQVEAFDSYEEAALEASENYDIYAGPVFWGVYMNMRHAVIALGGVNPTIHVQDFPSFDDALSFVTCINGVPEITYREEEE
jgi:hypothetical protein